MPGGLPRPFPPFPFAVGGEVGAGALESVLVLGFKIKDKDQILANTLFINLHLSRIKDQVLSIYYIVSSVYDLVYNIY